MIFVSRAERRAYTRLARIIAAEPLVRASLRRVWFDDPPSEREPAIPRMSRKVARASEKYARVVRSANRARVVVNGLRRRRAIP